MINYVGIHLTHRDFDEVYSRMVKTRPTQGKTFRLYYSALLDTNVHFSLSSTYEAVKDKLQLTLIGEKEFNGLRRVK